MTDRATVAIVRRHLDRRFGVDWLAQYALVAALGFVFSPTFVDSIFPIGIACALAAASAGERSHAAWLRRVTFFALPLFGRQLARAHVVAPLVLALAIPAGYIAGATLRHRAPAVETDVLLVVGALVATLISLSSIFRDGARAALYIVLAALVATAIAAMPARLAHPQAFPLALALAALTGFLALRAFGETLARYDPLPER